MLSDRDWEAFFKVSDVISYVEILEVEPSIDKSPSPSEPIPGPLFPKQRAKVKFLKILRGPVSLENTTSTIIKRRAYFYLIEKERLVLYLHGRNI